MEQILEADTQARPRGADSGLERAIGWGVAGGVAGTLAMDLLLIAGMRVMGWPALTCFEIVGDTLSSLFSALGIQIPGGVPTGIVTHYVVGPLFGGLFGILVAQVPAFHLDTMRKSVFLAVLYVETLSQPLLATTPLLLKMTTPEILAWYVGSFAMHFIMSVILGATVGYGLGLAARRIRPSRLTRRVAP